MKHIVLFIALAFAAFPAFAQDTEQTTGQKLTAELAKMDDSEKAKVLRYIESPTSEAARRAQDWIDVGAGIGESLAATAGKLGVEVNKFATTPVGKLAMVLIVWHYMGDDIMGIVSGLLWFAIFLPGWLYIAKRYMGIYDEKGKFVHFDRDFFHDNTRHGALTFVMVLSLVAIIIIGGVFIA